MREGVSEGWRGIAHRGGAEGLEREKEKRDRSRNGRGKREMEGGREGRPPARLPLSTGQWRHKSGIPGMRYIARGWRPGGYKL